MRFANVGRLLVVVVAAALLPTPVRGDDLGPYLSECVGSGCPPLTAYPSPFNFGPAPPVWRGHDEAFSGIVLGNFTVPAGGGAESEGRLAIGGDFLPAQGFSVGISGGGTFVVGPTNFDNLIVRQAATGTNSPFISTVATRGTTVNGLVRVGGAATGLTFDMGVLSQNVGMTPADLGIDLNAIFAQLQSKSACWSALTATGTLVDEVNLGNGWVLVGDNTSNPQVFNLGPNDLNVPNQELNFRNIPSGATVLVNVSGTNPIVGMARINADVTGMPVITTSPTLFNLLFNLYQATSASIPTEVNGSVLIPNGNLNLGGSINGRLAVGGAVTFSGSGQELHNYPFTGDLPSCGDTPTATVTGTGTVTETPTGTETETPTATETGTTVPTATDTGTATATATETAVATATGTETGTATETATATESVTPTPSDTATGTGTQTGTATETATPTETATATPTVTDTVTPSPTHTGTATGTATSSSSPTATATASVPPTATNTVPTPTASTTGSPTSTGTVTGTATATPLIPDGGSCTTPSQCASGFCVDDVCCDSACTGPDERCDVPGREGECLAVTPSPAPALSTTTLAFALLLLIGVAALALHRVALRG